MLELQWRVLGELLYPLDGLVAFFNAAHDGGHLNAQLFELIAGLQDTLHRSLQNIEACPGQHQIADAPAKAGEPAFCSFAGFAHAPDGSGDLVQLPFGKIAGFGNEVECGVGVGVGHRFVPDSNFTVNFEIRGLK